MTVSLLTAARDARLLGGSIELWPRQLSLLATLDGLERTHIYGRAFLFDFASGRVARITNREDCLSQTRRFNARAIAGPASTAR
jgi:hypothetical protein